MWQTTDDPFGLLLAMFIYFGSWLLAILLTIIMLPFYGLNPLFELMQYYVVPVSIGVNP